MGVIFISNVFPLSLISSICLMLTKLFILVKLSLNIYDGPSREIPSFMNDKYCR